MGGRSFGLLLAAVACADPHARPVAQPTPTYATLSTVGIPCEERVADCADPNDAGKVTVDGACTLPDLGAALAVALPGSEIVLCPGDQVGTFESAVPVRLIAAGGPDDTALVGDGGRTLALPGGSAVVGLTIRGGDAAYGDGGGLALTSAGDLAVTDCAIVENQAWRGGGVALVPNAHATFVDTTISDDTAGSGGGGLYVPGGATAELVGTTTISGNAGGYHSGGVFLEGGTLTGGSIVGNRLLVGAPGYLPCGLVGPRGGGGGVGVTGAAALEDTEVSGNSSPGDGGGVAVVCGGDAMLTRVDVHDNAAGSLGVGGGVFVHESAASMVDTEVRGNTAFLGGGLGAVLSSVTGGRIDDNSARDGGGVYLGGSELAGAEILSNVAAGYGGGLAAFTWDDALVAVSSTVLQDNVAAMGGGLALLYDIQPPSWCAECGAGAFQDVTVVRNVATENGGGIYNTVGGFAFTAGTVADNTAAVGGAFYSSAGDELGLYTLLYFEYGSFDYTSLVGAAFTDSTIVGNEATIGGGAYLDTLATLVSTRTDWGRKPDDNVSNDVTIGYSGEKYAGYATSAEFACWLRCEPEP